MDFQVSIVSLAYNRRENVRELLTALRCQSYPSFEVILVDNASPDGTAEMVHEQFPEVRLIEAGDNLGMVAYNLGFEAARGDYILVMDDDGLPGSNDWIEQVVARFEANPRLGALSCTIRMRDTGKIARDTPQFSLKGSLATGYPAVAFNGTGAGIRAAALRETDLYPWHFFRTYLELHLCTQLLDRGWQVRHFPDIEVWHSRSTVTNHRRPAKYHGLRNYYWYIWEFYPWPNLLTETVRRLGYNANLARRGDIPWQQFWRTTRDAFAGASKILAQRRPLDSVTLHYLLEVRKQDNWHGIAPERKQFDETLFKQ